MSLKERIKQLANDRGISLPALEAELGFGNSTIVKWDKSTPNADKLNAVAKYFGVSMDYLLNGTECTSEDEKENKLSEHMTQGYYLSEDTKNMAQFLYDNPEYKVLFDASRKVKKEDIQFVKEMIDRMNGEQ